MENQNNSESQLAAMACSGWVPIEEFAAGNEVFTAYAPHSQGGFQFSAVCNIKGRILCMMSLDDMTDQVTHARKQFDPPQSQNLTHQLSTPETDARTNRVMEQALASERFRATPKWVDASKWLPQGPHEVLATDGENWFVACLQGSEWWMHELDEPCDSVVTHWMELPEIPEE